MDAAGGTPATGEETNPNVEGGLTFSEFMDELYLFITSGYKHHHIDNEMDIWHYLRLNQKYREQDHSNSGNQNSNEMEVPAENII